MISPPRPLHDLPIGVFDSGVGGLTVVQAIRDALPQEEILYLGDTARVPYGNKGAQTVRMYAQNAASLLVGRGVKALVIACNTASAYGLEHLRALHPQVPIFGVIDPVAQRAASQSPTGSIALIGTRGTVASGCYPEAIAAYNPDARVVQLPCPLFVPLAEERWTTGPVVEAIARSYFEPLVSHDVQVDTMILGCTHYPILRDALGLVLDELMPRHVTLLDSAQATTARLVEHLDAHALRRHPRQERAALNFLVTDEPSGFLRMASTFFRGHLSRPEHVDLPAT